MAKQRLISAVLTLKDKNFSSGIKRSSSATRDLQRQVQHAGNSVGRFTKSAVSGFSTVTKGAVALAGAIGITKAVSGGINMVRNSLGSAFDRIDVMERFERVMTTITGSTEQARQALETTRDAVTGTAYGLDIAAKGVQDFVTRGMDVNKATNTIASFADAVAFYGDGSNEQLASVSDALAKMYSSGKVGMDQMSRLFDAGIDGVGMYAKAVGRDTTSVQKDLSSGKITAADFIEVTSQAMMEGTNGVQKISGAAKEAGASWRGTFANMRSAVTRGTTTIIEKIDDMLTSNGLPDMRTMIADFGKSFEDRLKSAADMIPVFASGFSAMYDKIEPGISWLKDTAIPGIKNELVNAYSEIEPGLIWMKDTGLPGVANAVGFVLDKGVEFYDFVKNNWSFIGPVVAGVAASIATLKVGMIGITVAQNLWKGATTALTIAKALLNGTLAISPLGWIAIAIGAVVTAGILLYKNWDTVKEKASLLWETTKVVFEGIYDWGMSKIQPVVDFFKSLGDRFNDFKSAISNFKLPDWVSSVGSTISNATSKVAGWINGSHATGLNRVPFDGYIAELHKDEMVIPARQSEKLRQQGVTIDNITNMPKSSDSGSSSTISNTSNGPVTVNVYPKGLTTAEVISELVPDLKELLSNM